MNAGTLLTLAGYFALLSLFAIGGANAALPEMHRLAVEVMHWMSERQFADMFAIAQMTPGPNVIVVTLIGYHMAASRRTTHEIAQGLIARKTSRISPLLFSAGDCLR
jgi:chromate transport protein ChrA